MNLIKHWLHQAQQFSVGDVAVFKLYILAVAFLLAIWAPEIVSLSVWFYVALFVVTYVFLLMHAWKKQAKTVKKIFSGDRSIKPLKKFGMGEMSLFKLVVFLSGLILAILFPEFLTAHIGWYIGVAGFGLGWILCRLLTRVTHK